MTTTWEDNSAAGVTYGGAPPPEPTPRWIEHDLDDDDDDDEINDLKANGDGDKPDAAEDAPLDEAEDAEAEEDPDEHEAANE
ncbi:MAG: hypothetical protein ACPG4T_00860 [Nannocystaceae bacterium]